MWKGRVVSKRGHIPFRMCVGCRQRKRKEDLVRFSHGPGGDWRRDDPALPRGRGLYLCPDPVCFGKAQKKNRGLRMVVLRDDRLGVKEERE